MPVAPHWVDRFTEGIAPRWTLRRVQARIARDLLARHYEAASGGRRTSGWPRSAGDANAAIGYALETLRQHARDLVRNNPYAESALTTIADHAVGWGITAKPSRETRDTVRTKALSTWEAWAETTACDADGREDFYGLQKLVMRTVAESGEAIVRRRWRRPDDGLPIPLQLQVLEPDYLDASKQVTALPDGGRVIQGVEFNGIGRRVAYWLFRDHPGSFISSRQADRIPASEVLHIYKRKRPGQVRGASWFAPVILRMKDFDTYEDAALVKQKIAACLAVITSDVDGSAPALGAATDGTPPIDSLEPGMILNAPPGRSISVVQPPTISEHKEYAETVLRAIATGLGMTYEDLTGDYSGLTFSAARMSRIRHWDRVHDWRWLMLIPQFCQPVWSWAMQAAAITGLPEQPLAEWSAPPMPMIEPQAEAAAYRELVRIGGITWPEMVRERGYDPETVLAEIAETNKKLDALGIVLDCDPRRTSQQGQPSQPAKAAPATVGSGNGKGS